MPCVVASQHRFQGADTGRGENMQGFGEKFSSRRLDGLRKLPPNPEAPESGLAGTGPCP